MREVVKRVLRGALAGFLVGTMMSMGLVGEVWATQAQDCSKAGGTWRGESGSEANGTCTYKSKTKDWCEKNKGTYYAPSSSDPIARCVVKHGTAASSTGTDTSSGTDTSTDTSTGSGTDTSTGTSTGTDTSTGTGTGTGTGTDTSTGSSTDDPATTVETSNGSKCGDNQVETSILGGDSGCYDVQGDGKDIFEMLGIVLDVLTYGVGAAGVIGIVIAAIQYATAAGNESQMTKAKTRIIEVVIGLIAYGLMYTFLQWLVPGGMF
ncbi:hypothetical protein IJI72_03020 [Candidatus Saccharibacteria bacterium]|nr:hypothetical protein [Candidatus Saccharibacteria bacterium]